MTSGDLLADTLEKLVQVAKRHGLRRVVVSTQGEPNGAHFRFDLPPAVIVAPAPEPQPLPLSKPTTPDGTRAARVLAYRDALEGAHVTGVYPELGDYGLTPGDL